MARKYKLKRRAEHQEDTRRRIVEATVELHESVGLAYTTISAIAERAGVERATVYRHFPDERSLFTACTSHYLAANPPPDPSSLQQIADPEQRLKVGLAEVYTYHRRTEEMNYRAQRDLPQFPALAEVLVPYVEHWARLRDVLAAGWQTQKGDNRLLRAAIGHAMNFQTWRSLAREEDLDDSEAVALMVPMVHCVAQGSEDDNTPYSVT
ncbi:MAG: TetR/AcrR family transcriptional regulator [Chloroflexota bacterium]|nr:TetR/AcrR family transcriptional regulator [Chloroflexota bacterium]